MGKYTVIKLRLKTEDDTAVIKGERERPQTETGLAFYGCTSSHIPTVIITLKVPQFKMYYYPRNIVKALFGRRKMDILCTSTIGVSVV